MKKVLMLIIIGLVVALWLCILSGGVEVDTSVRVRVGGHVWSKGERGGIRGYEGLERDCNSPAQDEESN